jgi:hypothetical protein
MASTSDTNEPSNKPEILTRMCNKQLTVLHICCTTNEKGSSIQKFKENQQLD